MIYGYSRGWMIIWDAKKKEWFYKDNDNPIDDKRVCKRCGEPPTKEGHDACLGTIPGVVGACCGHGTSINGISNRIMIYERRGGGDDGRYK